MNFMKIFNGPFFETTIFSNTVQSYMLAALIFFGVALALKLFQSALINHIKTLAQKTKTQIDDILIDGIKAIRWPVYVLVSINIALNILSVHGIIKMTFYYAMIVAVVFYTIKLVEEFINFGTKKIIENKKDGEESTEIVRLLASIVKILVWASAIVLILANMGYNVTSLVAGLGIGGLAIALAVQNVLSDIFSAFSIYFDKPFKVGDFVVLGEHSGTIKRIGIKSTRIQALQGEEIVISNNELTQARVQNFGMMERRRIVFTLGVTYDTKQEKLKRITGIIKDVIDKEKLATYNRSHFKTFGPSSLDYETVYFVETSDYAEYMNTQQNVNLEIVSRFEKEGIEFAFPTQTIHIEK